MVDDYKIDSKVPPLPKGYVKKESGGDPPLPAGYVKKKEDGTKLPTITVIIV